MVNSLLLHWSGTPYATSVIDLGVNLARRCAARVRGVTMLDTRRLTSLASTCESAAHAASEFHRLHQIEKEQGKIRSDLSQACVMADIDFDLRRVRGNPMEVLPVEAQFHDLVVTALPVAEHEQEQGGLQPSDWIDLLHLGVQPLLVIRVENQPLQRVLLVYDGTPASGKAVRTFLQQNLLPDADLRLLAVGQNPTQAQHFLQEMLDYCRTRKQSLEAGSLTGSVRKLLIPYAYKWQADLVVMGASRRSKPLRRMLGETAQDVLQKTPFALYVMA